MTRFARFLCLALATALAACSPTPVPADKLAYVGTWTSDTTRLVIGAEGHVAYEYKEGGVSKSIDAPIKAFKGNDFEVGIGPVSTTFVVNQLPHEEAGGWTMTVDGAVLRKAAS